MMLQSSMTLNWIQYPHGTIKWLLESSQGLLLRQPMLEPCVLIALLMSLYKVWRWNKQPPTQIELLSVLGFVIGLYFLPFYGLIGYATFALLLSVQFIETRYRGQQTWIRLTLRFFPLSWVILPYTSSHCIESVLFQRILRYSKPATVLGTLFLWQWTDLIYHYEQIRRDMEHWPTERLDSTIKELAHSAPGVRADWHGVRILGETAIITCERKPRLSAINLRTGHSVDTPLHPRWGVENVGPLESEISTQANLTWTVNGGSKLLENKWDGSKWTRYREVKLPSELGFSYIARSKDKLYITEVQTGDSKGTRKVLVAPLPSLNPIREVELKLNGEPAPMPREALWIPSIERHVYASEFGQYLYAANLETGEVTLWLEAQTFNGKMIWNDDTERIYLAVPNRMQIHVIDPTIPAIEYTLWTQPGVRALAVDATRNILLSASVLTGQIWVQNLQSGALIERMGTVYPMVREMEVSEKLGLGVLTTWNAVYRFDYTQQLSD